MRRSRKKQMKKPKGLYYRSSKNVGRMTIYGTDGTGTTFIVSYADSSDLFSQNGIHTHRSTNRIESIY